MLIRPVKLEEAEEVQKIYNHKDIISHLGGMTFLETIKMKTKSSGPTIFGAWDNEKLVGSMMIGSRNQCQYAKFGEVGVLPEYRRQRISTALYVAIIAQGILEGRRIWEDTIVGNNDIQMLALPTIGLEKWGVLRQKTASFLDIHIFGYLLSIDNFNRSIARLREDTRIELRFDYYSIDLRHKNIEIYEKKNSEFIQTFNYCLNYITNSKFFHIIDGEMKQEHNVGKKKHEEQLEL